MGQGPNIDRQLRRAFALGSWGPAEGFQLGGGGQFLLGLCPPHSQWQVLKNVLP